MESLTHFWDQFLIFLKAQPPGLIYFFLFLSAFMENVVPPIPGDTLIVFGAYLAGMGMIRVAPTFLVMWVGSALGCMLVYGVAYLKGRALFVRLAPRVFSEANLDRASAWFSRHGDRVVIFNRFLPTVRAFVGIVAGLSRMHPLRMLAYVLLGTLLWNLLLVYFGLMVGQNWHLVIRVLRVYNRGVLVLMVLGGIGFWVWYRKKKRASGEPRSEETEDRADRRA